MRKYRVGDRVSARMSFQSVTGTIIRVGIWRYLVEYTVCDDMWYNPPQYYPSTSWKFPWRIYR